jgi:hypothetical protein
MNRIDVAYTKHTQGDLGGAEALYRSMIRDGEDVISAANNLFVLLRGEARWSDLAQLYRDIETEIPQHGDWARRLYPTLLANEQYEAGWQWYEARRYDPRYPSMVPTLSMPEWTGGPVERLLVWREQGLGDEIQFARFVPEIARRGVKVTLLCNPGLARLFSGLPAEIVPLSGQVQLAGDYDAWSLVGSLPLRLGAPFTVPPPLPVTAAPRGRGGIGVMTAGSRQYDDDPRSMPEEVAARLLTAPGAISLRPEDTGAQDFQDTAEIIAGLDLVVTVDTSVAHLAGSMGKPTWVMLPAAGQDWRWLRARKPTPWYPSARLMLQPSAGDWGGLVDQVLQELAARG